MVQVLRLRIVPYMMEASVALSPILVNTPPAVQLVRVLTPCSSPASTKDPSGMLGCWVTASTGKAWVNDEVSLQGACGFGAAIASRRTARCQLCSFVFCTLGRRSAAPAGPVAAFFKSCAPAVTAGC